jgi:hypothetical protein
LALAKVTETVLYAIASTASNAVSVGSAVDVSAYYGASIRIRMGRATSSAFTVAPEIRVEANFKATADANSWVSIYSFSPSLGTSIASQAVSGTEAAGQTVVTLAAGTNFAANDYVFFHNTTLANSEWKRVVSVASADLTLQDALVNAQTGSTVRDQAEEYFLNLDLTSIQDLRLVVNGATGTGQAVIIEAGFGAVSDL